MSEDLAPLIEGRPAAALARRVAPEYGGHMSRVLPTEWLAGLDTNPSGATIAEPRGSEAILRSAGVDDAKIDGIVHPSR